MATQYTCSLNHIYCPHWLEEWSRHCSHMHIAVQSSWLPGYITVVQTTLVILTMAGLFLDRLHILGKLILEEVRKWDIWGWNIPGSRVNSKGEVLGVSRNIKERSVVGVEGTQRVGDEIQEGVRNWSMKIIRRMLAFGLKGMGHHWRVLGRGVPMFRVSWEWGDANC